MAEKEGPDFTKAALRHISDNEKQYLQLKLEQSRIHRERAAAVLDKGLMLYFGTLLVAVLGHIYEFAPKEFLNLLIIAGICILVLSIIPYLKVSRKSEKQLDELIDSLVGKF